MTHLQGNFDLAHLWLLGHTQGEMAGHTEGATAGHTWGHGQDTPTGEFALAQLWLGHTQGA